MQNRIFIVIDAFTNGGAQKVLLSLIPEWEKSGSKVELVLLQDNTREMTLEPLVCIGIPIHRISARNIFDLRALIFFLRLTKSFNPTQIQCHLFWSQMWGGIARILVSGSGLSWVEHNTYVNRTRSQWLAYRIMSGLTRQIVGVSQEVQEFLWSKGIKSAEVIVNPVSQSFRYLSSTERKNNFTFLGRLNDQKNPRLAIQAFEYAISNQLIPEDSTLTIAGDGPLLEDLRDYVGGLNSTKSIIFTGHLDESETVHLLQSSICLLSTSKFEGFSLVRVEALGTGATVITTETGGIKGILTQSEDFSQLISGVIIVKSEVVPIADAMSAVISPAFWTKESIFERLEAAKRHSSELISQTYLARFHVTEKRNRKRRTI